jgi:hypothetical protein
VGYGGLSNKSLKALNLKKKDSKNMVYRIPFLNAETYTYDLSEEIRSNSLQKIKRNVQVFLNHILEGEDIIKITYKDMYLEVLSIETSASQLGGKKAYVEYATPSLNLIRFTAPTDYMCKFKSRFRLSIQGKIVVGDVIFYISVR